MRHLAVGVVLTLLYSLGSSARAAAKPNIIYFLADDLGYAELGCYGQKIIRTPNLDRMAAEGIRFTQHYSGQAVCAPSRCVLMTGRHTGHCAIRNNRSVQPEGNWPLPDAEVTLAELLQQAGYATAAIGKWGLGMPGNPGDPNKQGFDLFYGYHCQRHAHNHYPRYLRRNQNKVILEGNDRTLTGKQYSQDLFTAEALQFIRQNKDRPFFLYMPFAIPHLSIQVPEQSLAEYKGKIPEEDYEHRGYLKHPFPRAGYAAMITHMDRDIGQVMALVKKLGLDENTLVLFSSDNGPTYERLGGSDSEFFQSAGVFRGLKGSLYEGGIRVPMIARWPSHIKPGRTSDHISAFWDVLPTLCDIVGLTPPQNIDGISFAPTLLGQSNQKQHEYLYWEFRAYGGQQVVRMGNWKGVRQNLVPKGKNKDQQPNLSIELYDLATDPGEKHNAADQHPEIVERIAAIMTNARTPNPDFPIPALDGS